MWQTITWKGNTTYILPRCNGTNAGVVLKKWNRKRFCLENIKEYTSTIQHYVFGLRSYKDNIIKIVERIGRGSGLKYLLKSPNMIMPSEFSIFMKNGENEITLLNLIEQVYVQDNTKLQDRMIYFSNETDSLPENQCRWYSLL